MHIANCARSIDRVAAPARAYICARTRMHAHAHVCSQLRARIHVLVRILVPGAYTGMYVPVPAHAHAYVRASTAHGCADVTLNDKYIVKSQRQHGGGGCRLQLAIVLRRLW